MKVFMIAGEASGDVVGAGLIESLREETKDKIEILGIGGPLMEEAGMNVLLPMSELSVIGIAEVIAQLPRLHKIYSGVISEIRKHKPDVVVTIDFPDFNFMVGRAVKKMGGIKVVHYVAPTVWAWRSGRAAKIAKFLDGLICLYPFEPPYFKKHKLKAIYAGHPLVEADTDNINPAALQQKLEMPENARTLGLFFGSRPHELEALSPIIKEAAILILEKFPDTEIIVPTLPQIEFEIRQLMSGFPYHYRVLSDQDVKWDTFSMCNGAIAVSGTVGLELAWLDVPHVIAYKASFVTGAIAKLLVKTKFAHLANIILQQQAVPEFVQKNCTSDKIAEGVLKLYEDETEIEKQRVSFAKVREIMRAGVESKPSRKAARFILHMAGKKSAAA